MSASRGLIKSFASHHCQSAEGAQSENRSLICSSSDIPISDFCSSTIVRFADFFSEFRFVQVVVAAYSSSKICAEKFGVYVSGDIKALVE